MSDIRFFSQPCDGGLGKFITDLLNDAVGEFDFAVAFARESGIRTIGKSLALFRSSGGQVRAFVGVDLEGTSYEALVKLLDVTDSLYVVHVEDLSSSFHPKVYNLKVEDGSILIVGSHNLTAGGLSGNFESSAILKLSLDDEKDRVLQDRVDGYFKWLMDHTVDDKHIAMQVTSKEEIEWLLNQKLVKSEEDIQSAKRAALKNEMAEDRHTGQFPANAGMRISQPKMGSFAAVEESADTDFKSLWLESNPTGGSCNQLNLSRKGVILKGEPQGTRFEDQKKSYMKGALHFFDIINEEDHDDKLITVEYGGVFYKGNKIHFYCQGDGKNPNDSWRLQLEGESSEGTKMQDAYQNENLKDKVILFTKLDTADTYKMEIYDKDDMERFETKSLLVGRNGTNKGKKFGLF